jgi:hypothetical protein
MGLEYDLSETEGLERLKDLKLELSPRYQCRNYVRENNGKATLIKKEEFDLFYKNKEFSDGPFKESFGDGYGEPYNPDRQAFGKLKSGLVVYCELSENFKKKTDDLLS